MIYIKNIFKRIPIEQVAQDDLEAAERQLLSHEATEAYHRHLSAYYRERIEKLREHVKPKTNAVALFG